MLVPLLLLSLGALPPAQACPGPAWAVAGSSCYLSSPGPLTWQGALDYCHQQGGHLAEVETAGEQELLAGMFGPEEYYWIGLTDMAHHGRYRWRHSQTYPEYTNWGPDQPDSADQHCVFLWGTHGGEWADYHCEASQSSGGRDIHALCEQQADGDPPLKVLWLGNSYTYYNDLPGLVGRLAAAEGRAIEFSNHTEGGWSWEDHAQSKVTLDMIKSKAWDVVVLQEQSRRPAYPAAEVCADSVPYLGTLVEAIRSNRPDTVLQFYLTWGRPFGYEQDCVDYPALCQFPTMQAALTASYRAFACQNPPSRVAAVGEGFATFWDSDTFLTLYKDGGGDHHPSLVGSYLSAASHYNALFDTSAVGSSFTAGLDEETALLMQETADAVWTGGAWTYAVGGGCTDCLCHCSKEDDVEGSQE